MQAPPPYGPNPNQHYPYPAIPMQQYPGQPMQQFPIGPNGQPMMTGPLMYPGHGIVLPYLKTMRIKKQGFRGRLDNNAYSTNIQSLICITDYANSIAMVEEVITKYGFTGLYGWPAFLVIGGLFGLAIFLLINKCNTLEYKGGSCPFLLANGLQPFLYFILPGIFLTMIVKFIQFRMDSRMIQN